MRNLRGVVSQRPQLTKIYENDNILCGCGCQEFVEVISGEKPVIQQVRPCKKMGGCNSDVNSKNYQE